MTIPETTLTRYKSGAEMSRIVYDDGVGSLGMRVRQSRFPSVGSGRRGPDECGTNVQSNWRWRLGFHGLLHAA